MVILRAVVLVYQYLFYVVVQLEDLQSSIRSGRAGALDILKPGRTCEDDVRELVAQLHSIMGKLKGSIRTLAGIEESCTYSNG